MQGFDDVTLTWKGEEFTIPADNILMLIMRLEDALSGDSNEQAISVLLRPGGPPYARLSAAFGAALRYAGADVSDMDVYQSIQQSLADGNGKVMQAVNTAVIALLSIMAPPLAAKISGDEPGKKTKAAKE